MPADGAPISTPSNATAPALGEFTFAPGTEPVHFSRDSNRKSRTSYYASRVAFCGWASLIGIPACVAVFFFGLGRLLPALLLAVMPMVAESVPMIISSWRRRRWRRRSPSPIAREPSPDYRVCVVGVPAELETCGSVCDVPFEPQLFKASLTTPPPNRPMLALVTIMSITIGLLAGLAAHSFVGSRLQPVPIAWATALTAFAAYAWFRPIYYRVVPGRLDVMRFPVFRSTPPQVQHYDLKSSKLLIDLRRHLLFIDGPAGSAELSFALLLGRRQFAHAVLLAALSTYPPGPVPDDRLLG